ncbi:hypothetical protein Q6247_26440, partial [Klebsiella pneumoniae]
IRVIFVFCVVSSDVLFYLLLIAYSRLHSVIWFDALFILVLLTLLLWMAVDNLLHRMSDWKPDIQ